MLDDDARLVLSTPVNVSCAERNQAKRAESHRVPQRTVDEVRKCVGLMLEEEFTFPGLAHATVSR